MNATPAKFTFDVDMSQGDRNTRVINQDKLGALLDEARQEGLKQGRAEGEKTETARTGQALLAAAEKIADEAARLAGATDRIRRDLLADAVGLGVSVGTKLAGRLVAREPAAELEALIAECFGSINHAPHLVIRCHPDLADTLREIAEQRMKTGGFAGRLVVMGEPDIALGDGRIEWVDGGLVRDSNAVSEQIDKCIAGYLAASGASSVGENEQ